MTEAPMTEAEQAIADRDWWNAAALPGWKLCGWTDRYSAIFYREDGSWGEIHMTGELAGHIHQLRWQLERADKRWRVIPLSLRLEALRYALSVVKSYEADIRQHGSLPVDPHECAAQVAREIAASLEARIALTLSSPQG